MQSESRIISLKVYSSLLRKTHCEFCCRYTYRAVGECCLIFDPLGLDLKANIYPGTLIKDMLGTGHEKAFQERLPSGLKGWRRQFKNQQTSPRAWPVGKQSILKSDWKHKKISCVSQAKLCKGRSQTGPGVLELV